MSSAKEYSLVAQLRQQLADAQRDVEAANYLRDRHREESVQLRAQVAKLESELRAWRDHDPEAECSECGFPGADIGGLCHDCEDEAQSAEERS